jgi:hypothetical protein
MCERKDWMSDDQWACVKMLAQTFGGHHHLPKIHKFGQGIKINVFGHLATFDHNRLTRLVVLAHDQMVRTEIVSSGPGMVGVACWKRHTRDGSMFERHPTLEDAVTFIRSEAA